MTAKLAALIFFGLLLLALAFLFGAGAISMTVKQSGGLWIFALVSILRLISSGSLGWDTEADVAMPDGNYTWPPSSKPADYPKVDADCATGNYS
jgi:hypothetical protein